MNHLKEFVEVIQEIDSIRKEIDPLQAKLNEKTSMLRNLNEELDVNPCAFDFLIQKLIENFTEEELQDLANHRQYVKDNIEGPSVRYDSYLEKVFDPQYDDWYIYNYEEDKETGKIRFAVSCKKNEGHISGLVTFLDSHYTSWFNINEFNDD